jgi:hypothetical protein
LCLQQGGFGERAIRRVRFFRWLSNDDRLVCGQGLLLLLVSGGEQFFAATAFYCSNGRH